MKVTAETLTVELIDALYSDQLITSLTRDIAKRNLVGPPGYDESKVREHCADVWNRHGIPYSVVQDGDS